MNKINKLQESKKKQFVNLLLNWNEANRRAFPWRKERTPYRVLSAEILLQRTPAARVAHFYPALIAKFPSPRTLISTKQEIITEFFRPMGLVKRATWLTKLMTEVCVRYECRIPDNEEELLQLPGVGKYTARAVLVFAYKKDLAIVDVNVARVLHRVFGGLGEEKRPSENKKLWSFADELIPKTFGISYNEGLLDFAALVCKKAPLCSICPMTRLCKYYRLVVSVKVGTPLRNLGSS